MFKTFGSWDRRDHTRHPVRRTHSRLGQVLDLSASGALLYRKGSNKLSLEQELKITIRHESRVVELDCRVAHMRPVGLRRAEIGVEFIAPSPEQQAVLRALLNVASSDYGLPIWAAS